MRGIPEDGRGGRRSQWGNIMCALILPLPLDRRRHGFSED